MRSYRWTTGRNPGTWTLRLTRAALWNQRWWALQSRRCFRVSPNKPTFQNPPSWQASVLLWSLLIAGDTKERISEVSFLLCSQIADVHWKHPHKQPFVGKTIMPIPRQTWLPQTGKKKLEKKNKPREEHNYNKCNARSKIQSCSYHKIFGKS